MEDKTMKGLKKGEETGKERRGSTGNHGPNGQSVKYSFGQGGCKLRGKRYEGYFRLRTSIWRRYTGN